VTEDVSLFVIEPATEVPSFRTMVAGCEFEVAAVLLFPQALSSARMAGTAIRANDLNRISIPPDTSLARCSEEFKPGAGATDFCFGDHRFLL
jgi:hypothetical protein